LSAPSTHIRIQDIDYRYEDFHYRTPIKFGGAVVDRATLVNVECVVQTVGGRTAKGFGSMPLGNVWSFPSRLLDYAATLHAMKTLAAQIAHITADYQEVGHPVDVAVALEPAYRNAAVEVSQRLQLAEPIPPLCTLVTASAFEAAVHDAFGKVHGLNCYHTSGPCPLYTSYAADDALCVHRDCRSFASGATGVACRSDAGTAYRVTVDGTSSSA